MDADGKKKKDSGLFKNGGLKTRLVAAFITAWLFDCTCLAACLYQMMVRQHHESIRTSLHDYVAIAAKAIDLEKHTLLKNPEDKVGDTYKRIVADLRSIRDSISDIKIYTARLKYSGKLIFIADTEGTAVIALISQDISDLNAAAGDISNNSSHIEQSADDLRRLATKLNRLIGRFKF